MTGKVIAHGTIHIDGFDPKRFEELKTQHENLTRAEPGCVRFSITAHPRLPATYVVQEEFTDQAAFEAHTKRTRASAWWAQTQSLERRILAQAVPSSEPVENWREPPAPPADLVLEGARVRLERLDPERHGPDLFAANSSTENWAYLPYGPFEDVTAYQEWIRQSCSAEDPHFFAIHSKASNTWVGVASYLRIAPQAGSIEVGHINFSPVLQRDPAATEAMFLMMQWAFEAGYRRYEWKCNAANLASRRAAIRLGLSYEGIFRQMMIVKGRNRDTAWFAAIDGEWPHLKKAFETWLAPHNFRPDGQQILRLSDLTRPHLVATDPGLE